MFFTFCHKGGVICISEIIDIWYLHSYNIVDTKYQFRQIMTNLKEGMRTCTCGTGGRRKKACIKIMLETEEPSRTITSMLHTELNVNVNVNT